MSEYHINVSFDFKRLEKVIFTIFLFLIFYHKVVVFSTIFGAYQRKLSSLVVRKRAGFLPNVLCNVLKLHKKLYILE